MEEFEDFGVVEREELMVSPAGDGDPTWRSAHFLQPTVTSIDGPVFEIPSHCMSSLPPSFEPINWPLAVKYNGWRHPQREWKTWVERMFSLHESTWRKSGIVEVIWSSTYITQKQNELVLGLAEKWCPDTKSFIFSWGEATITLEDLLVSGYSVLGSPIFGDLEAEELKKVEQRLNQARTELNRSSSKKPDHNAWLRKFRDSGSNIEHEAFLALWLSRFVFPVSFDVIAQAVFPIAVQLSRGTRIALAPAILATIYRDLGLLKEKIVSLAGLENCGDKTDVLEITIRSPFQLVQIWAWERFIEFRSKTNMIRNGEPRCAQWNTKMIGVGNVRRILDSAGASFDWRPYAKTLINWKLPEFYAEKEMWIPVDADLLEDFEAFGLCLRASELVGLDCVEQYLPHRVAMQFGMDQDLPACVARANDTPHVAWSCYSKPFTSAKLYIPLRLYEAEVTTQYSKWWKQSLLRLKQEGEVSLPPTRTSTSFKVTPKGSKAEKVSCFNGSKKTLKSAKHENEGDGFVSFKMEPKRPISTTECNSTKRTEVSSKRLDGMNEGDSTHFCSSSLNSSEQSLKTSKKKKKNVDASVTLGFLLKKARKSVETSKEKEKVCNVSASAGLPSKVLSPSLTVKKVNDYSVPPGFAPKFNFVQTRDSVGEDDLTVADILRSSNVRFKDGKKSSHHTQKFSSMADNEDTKITGPPTELVEKIMQNEPLKGKSKVIMEDAVESTSNTPDNDIVRTLGSESRGNIYENEPSEFQFEDRVSRLEKIFVELMAARLHH